MGVRRQRERPFVELDPFHGARERHPQLLVQLAEMDEVVARRRDRVDVVTRDEENDDQWDEQTAEVDATLTDLAKHEEDEHGVDEVVGGGHADDHLLAAPARRRPAG